MYSLPEGERQVRLVPLEALPCILRLKGLDASRLSNVRDSVILICNAAPRVVRRHLSVLSVDHPNEALVTWPVQESNERVTTVQMSAQKSASENRLTQTTRLLPLSSWSSRLAWLRSGALSQNCHPSPTHRTHFRWIPGRPDSCGGCGEGRPTRTMQ